MPGKQVENKKKSQGARQGCANAQVLAAGFSRQQIPCRYNWQQQIDKKVPVVVDGENFYERGQCQRPIMDIQQYKRVTRNGKISGKQPQKSKGGDDKHQQDKHGFTCWQKQPG